MQIIPASPGAEYSLDGIVFTALASPSRGSSQNAMWRIQMRPDVPAHPHRVDREELIHALSGRALASIDGREQALGAGDTLVVLPGQLFSLTTAGTGSFDAIAVAPAGLKATTEQGEFAPPWTL